MSDHTQVTTDDDLIIDLRAQGRALRVEHTDDNVVLLLPTAEANRDEQPLVVRLQEALDASHEMILVVEDSGQVLFANRTARTQLGLVELDAPFRPIETLLRGQHRDEVWTSLEESNQWSGAVSTARGDGSTVHLELTLLADRTATGDLRTLTVVATDVGEQRALQQALEHHSTHDALTGLYNRRHLLGELGTILTELGTRAQSGALVLVDIDEFRTVTNSLGHEAGDRVLVAFAYRLLRTFSTNAILARVGGDEFAVFCPGPHDIDALAEQVFGATTAPFYVDGTEVHLTVAAGIAVTNPFDTSLTAESLLREADAAAYRAKERGRGEYEVFEPELQTEAAGRFALVGDMRRALRTEEFLVHYQPKISLDTGFVIGAEALVRWQDPTQGMRVPGEFLDVAEQTGLIVPIGRWVMAQACRDAAELQQLVGPDRGFEIAVNMSVRQLDDPTCAGDVEDAIAASGLDASFLEIEITESALMNDVEASARVLTMLKDLGASIAIDDFGTGYSSLQYLQRLPVDVLKVDQSFTSDIDGTAAGSTIVSAIVHLAADLGMTSVAEGVETPEQLAVLRALGCDSAQGYFIAKPMPLADLRTLIRQDPRW